jgi:hypothetical protein
LIDRAIQGFIRIGGKKELLWCFFFSPFLLVFSTCKSKASGQVTGFKYEDLGVVNVSRLAPPLSRPTDHTNTGLMIGLTGLGTKQGERPIRITDPKLDEPKNFRSFKNKSGLQFIIFIKLD